MSIQGRVKTLTRKARGSKIKNPFKNLLKQSRIILNSELLSVISEFGMRIFEKRIFFRAAMGVLSLLPFSAGAVEFCVSRETPMQCQLVRVLYTSQSKPEMKLDRANAQRYAEQAQLLSQMDSDVHLYSLFEATSDQVTALATRLDSMPKNVGQIVFTSQDFPYATDAGYAPDYQHLRKSLGDFPRDFRAGKWIKRSDSALKKAAENSVEAAMKRCQSLKKLIEAQFQSCS